MSNITKKALRERENELMIKIARIQEQYRLAAMDDCRVLIEDLASVRLRYTAICEKEFRESFREAHAL